ncbi:hypothetical protein GBF38_015689, partial [Nibea albiflora]
RQSRKRTLKGRLSTPGWTQVSSKVPDLLPDTENQADSTEKRWQYLKAQCEFTNTSLRSRDENTGRNPKKQGRKNSQSESHKTRHESSPMKQKTKEPTNRVGERRQKEEEARILQHEGLQVETRLLHLSSRFRVQCDESETSALSQRSPPNRELLRLLEHSSFSSCETASSASEARGARTAGGGVHEQDRGPRGALRVRTEAGGTGQTTS